MNRCGRCTAEEKHEKTGDKEEDEMTRTITVKGVGSATARPDYVIISMTLDRT